MANLLILLAQPGVMMWGGVATLAGLVVRPLGQAVGWVAWVFLTYTIEVMRLTARVPFASLPVRMGGGAVAGYERWQQLLEVEGAAVYQAAVCTP